MEETVIDQNINIIKKENNLDIYEEKIPYENEEVISPTRNNDTVFVGIKQEIAAETEVPSKSLVSR